MSAAIYGGVEGGMTDEADEFIRSRDGRHARQAPRTSASPVTTYVALVRAINVAGKKMLMSDLREIIADAGFDDAQTYIQSGNAVFTGARQSSDSVAKQLEAAMKKFTGVDTRAVVRSASELKAAITANPYVPRDDEDKMVHATFLASKPAAAAVKALDPKQFAPDMWTIKGRDIFVHAPGGYGVTKITNNYFEKKLGVVATTRNWRTVKKLSELAS